MSNQLESDSLPNPSTTKSKTGFFESLGSSSFGKGIRSLVMASQFLVAAKTLNAGEESVSENTPAASATIDSQRNAELQKAREEGIKLGRAIGRIEDLAELLKENVSVVDKRVAASTNVALSEAWLKAKSDLNKTLKKLDAELKASPATIKPEDYLEKLQIGLSSLGVITKLLDAEDSAAAKAVKSGKDEKSGFGVPSNIRIEHVDGVQQQGLQMLEALMLPIIKNGIERLNSKPEGDNQTTTTPSSNPVKDAVQGFRQRLNQEGREIGKKIREDHSKKGKE